MPILHYRTGRLGRRAWHAMRAGRSLSILWVAALSAAATAGAQSPTTLPDTLYLSQALRLASARSPALARADARVGMALGDLRSVGQWPNPTLEYRRENLGAPLAPDEFVTAYIPVDLTGRRVQLHRATTRGRARLEAERIAVRRDVELEIARAWVHAVLATDLGQSFRVQRDAVQEIATRDSVRAREGAVAEAIALRTRVEATRLAQDLVLAESQAQRDRNTLATLLGLAADSLPALPHILDAEAAPPLRFELTTLDGLDTSGDAATDDAELLRRARSDRASLRAAELARDEATLRRRVEQAGVLGDWQLQGGTKKTSGFLTGQVGLAVPLPLFNRNTGARQRAESAVRETDAAARAVELQVDGEVLAAAAQLRILLALRTRMAETPALGEVIASSARVAYAEGEMSLLELLDAQRAATDARTAAQKFHANLHLARLTLARAIGAPLVPGSP